MSYIVFARKYRPKNFDEIIGQGHITTTLKNAIEQKRVAHAYLFCGPRGVGKTTTARIFAKSLNCQDGPTIIPCNKCISCREVTSGTSMDVIEIDGASNRGIDEVRELRENVKFTPTHGRYKLYIIDEVHMLTPEAFNALLKTLEEPPSHVKFIFATTRPDKILPTISSRCQRFDFRRLKVTEIVSKLKEIVRRESIKVNEETLFIIGKQADGSLRDAESILDQMNAFCNGDINKEDISRMLWSTNEELLEDFTELFIKKDTQGALNFIDKLVSEGKDLPFFLASLIDHFRNLMVAKVCTKPEQLIDLSKETVEKIVNQAKSFSLQELFYISNILSSTYESMRKAVSARTVLELTITKITERASLMSLDELLKKVQEIGQRMKTKVAGRVISESELPNSNDTFSSNSKKNISATLSVKSKEDPLSSPQNMSVSTIDTGLASSDNIDKRIDKDINADKSSLVAGNELAQIQQIWPSFLNILKNKKISLSSYLLDGNIVALQSNILTIGFPKDRSLCKEVLEQKDNKHLMEETLNGILKKPIKIRFVTLENFKKGTTYTGNRKYKDGETSFAPETSQESIIQFALEEFKGRIVRKTQIQSIKREEENRKFEDDDTDIANQID